MNKYKLYTIIFNDSNGEMDFEHFVSVNNTNNYLFEIKQEWLIEYNKENPDNEISSKDVLHAYPTDQANDAMGNTYQVALIKQI